MWYDIIAKQNREEIVFIEYYWDYQWTFINLLANIYIVTSYYHVEVG